MSDAMEVEIAEQQKKRKADNQRSLVDQDKAKVSLKAHSYDSDIYGAGGSKYAGYDQSIEVGGDAMSEDEDDRPVRQLDSYTAPSHLLNEFADPDAEDPLLGKGQQRQIQSRESDYQKRRFDRDSGETARLDPFAPPADGESGDQSSYKEAMRRRNLEREEQRVAQAIKDKAKEDQEKDKEEGPRRVEAPDATPRKRRWDVAAPEDEVTVPKTLADSTNTARGEWDDSAAAPPKKRKSRWDETPAPAPVVDADAPAPVPARRSRWDQTPVGQTAAPSAVVPKASMPVAPLTAADLAAYDRTNRPFTDEELDMILPSEGYEVVEPPAGYAPLKRFAAAANPMEAGFMIQDDVTGAGIQGLALPDLSTDIEGVGQLAFFKQEDAQYFAKILKGDADDAELTTEELKERKIMRLLLKIKNGTPPMRKSALRQITEKARDFGAGPLFDKILPLLMERSLEDQERHLLVKVIDRVLYKLDDLVRPYVHKILVVIEPLLIDEDYYARVEGREIISNLSKAAGLAHMISTMRPDIDHVDEYVRNTTARAFSVVASALGIPALLPFIKAVCRSKKSWQARHTGIKIVQQIAIMMGCAVLPHLKNLVESIAHGLDDEQQKVRTMTALAIAALAEAAAPYGIESFDSVLKPLWTGIRKHRGKGLAAFLKAIGFIIPLMDPEYANYYTKEVMIILIREFQSPDEEMKKIVLKVVKQCAGTEGVTPAYVRDSILPEFFRNYWVRRMALDRRNYKQVVETTVELAGKAGVSEIINRIVNGLKDDSEPYRKMVMETIQKVIETLGATDIDDKLEEILVDGIIYGFQEQTVEDAVMLDGFGTVVNALGIRVKPYLGQVVSTILWRLNNKSAKVRQQAADLVSKLAVVIKQCGEDALLSKLGVVLFEQLGEEYPDTLGSIIAAEAAIANVVGMTQMSPPVKDLLPRMTPILRNRHEKVQEASINLIGRIADRGAEFVSAREWMRICFELLDLLKAHKKAIRRAAVNSFGYIAKAIGPQDVLSVLLTNLRVQDRQSRVCSTVAIGALRFLIYILLEKKPRTAIVAETTGPFTCIPAILNEYRTPELNVRNGCLKALSFLFEYIGEMGKDYIWAVVGLLEDALTDRDAVHRQTAAAIVKHITLGVTGLGHEEALMHLMNLLWPNVLEQSPHVVNNMFEAIEAMSISVGPGVVLSYTMTGLFHPARKMREAYWRIYNQTYLRHQDAMVPFYPNLDVDDSRNSFRRDPLYLWV